MSSINNFYLKPPEREPISDNSGVVNYSWQAFFRKIGEILKYLGFETSFKIVNNTSSAADITYLKLDKQFTSVAIIDYFIQRITSSVELNQSGTLHAVYEHSSATWNLREYGTAGPDSAGITFSITSSGQIQYTSSNIAGTETISRLIYRKRELAGKTSVYSKMG